MARRQRQFEFALVPNLIALAFLPLLLWLGTWQYGKGEQKAASYAQYEANSAVNLNANDEFDVAQSRFQGVSAKGQFLSDKQFLIDNMVFNGRNGFFVITPFQLVANDKLLLVNRGWIAQDPARQVLPSVTVTRELLDITGRVGKLPVGGLKLDVPDPGDDTWPSVRQFPNIEELGGALGQEVLNWVLLLETPENASLPHEWKPGGLPPERHLGYAVQWFSLAACLVVLMVFLNFPRVRNNDEHN